MNEDKIMYDTCRDDPEMETGTNFHLREESGPLECGRPTCHTSGCYVLTDKYRQQTNTANRNQDCNNNHYCSKKINFSYERGRNRILWNGSPSFRHWCEEACKSKFRRKPSMSPLLIFLCIFSCLLACEAKHSMRGGPPRLIGEAKTKVTATVGQTLTLPCMVAADPFPLTSWELNGEQISPGRPRFKQHGTNLRIRDVRTSDEGTYICTATNGFGSADVEIKLAVQAAMSERSSPTKPRFLLSAKMRKRNFMKPVGSFLRLRCRASGHPTPNIEWYKDGNLTVPATASSGKQRRPTWIYTVRGLTLNHSGQYRCRVWNSAGEISYTYKLKVVDKLRDRPILLEPHPMNTTVRVGGMTTIQCRVQSVVKPTIKWIKRLTKTALASYGEDWPQNIITIESKHYLILPEKEMLTLPDGSYLNKLVIRGATEKHAGMYICLGANTMGYNYRYAYLTVKPADPVMSSLQGTPLPNLIKPIKPPISRKQNNLPLPVIIGIPSGIGLLMAIVITWYCQRRRDDRLKSEEANVVVSGSDRLSAVGSVDTRSSTRSTPVPQESENSTGDLSGENTNKDNPQTNSGHTERQQSSEDKGRQDSVYIHRHRAPPTVGTPLLTVTEPDDTDFQINVRSDDELRVPSAPPPSEAAPSHATTYYSSSDQKGYRFVPPSPPPPSRYSASSVSSYPDTMTQFPPHYHYMHPPHTSSNSRRHHHHYHGHPRGDHSHYGY